MSGDFGPRFVWCGDVFARAALPMYVDSIHYSAEGARVLASAIVERSALKGLLPAAP